MSTAHVRSDENALPKGKRARRKAKKVAVKAAGRDARHNRKTAQHPSEPRTHRLVSGHASVTDDLGWERHREHGLRAEFIAERDRTTITLAMEKPANESPDVSEAPRPTMSKLLSELEFDGKRLVKETRNGITVFFLDQIGIIPAR